jgi:alkylhydroperoxidase/carboxymuconolactone decarboxylase family protein YurZ
VTLAAHTDAMLGQMAEATAAHAWAVPGLTEREKVFLTLVADVCHPTLGAPFEEHVRDGVGRGVPTAAMRALLRLVAYDTGYPAARAALLRLAEVEASLGLPAEGGTEELPPELLDPDGPSPLPEPVRAQLLELDAHFLEFFDAQSRMRSPAGPGTLTVRERAFTTMSVDVHYQTLGDTFRIHVERARRGGASVADVRDALRFLAQFGASRAWQAWERLNTLL